MSAARGRYRSLWAQIRLAASFLTILPVGPRRPATAEDLAGSFGWFPLLGFVLGAMLVMEDRILAHLIGAAIRSALLIMTLVVITGAVHLDGLADAADALGAGGDRTRALEIMRDSGLGSFGTAAIFFVLALKIVAIASAVNAARAAALYLAPGLGRWAMVAVAYRLDYLRHTGAGAALLAGGGSRNFALASAIALAGAAVMGWFDSSHAVRACVVAAPLTLIARVFYRRWLGGVTGDLIGAAGEIVETAVLIVVAN